MLYIIVYYMHPIMVPKFELWWLFYQIIPELNLMFKQNLSNMIGYTLYKESCEFESHSGEVYLIQHYVIKFICDLQQVVVFPPPIKLTATI